MPNNIVKSFSDKTGKSEEEVEKLWNKSENIVKKEYDLTPKDEGRFYSLVTGILKKMLKIDEDYKENKMKKFDTLVERYMRSIPADAAPIYNDGKAKIMLFSFDPNGVNTFRASMLEKHITKGVVEVNSHFLPTELITLKVVADNIDEEESIRELALLAGGVEYIDDDTTKIIPNA